MFFTKYIFVICVMNLQKKTFFNWYYLFVILVAYLKASTLSLVPLVICVMHLIYLKFICIQWDKFELRAMLFSNNLILYIHDFPLDALFSFSRTISYVYVSLRMYIFMVGLIRNLYIWERSPFSWYPISFWATLCFIYNSLVAPNLFHECLSYCLLVSLHTHIFLEDLWPHAYLGEHVDFSLSKCSH